MRETVASEDAEAHEDMDAVLARCRAMMSNGSRSFSFAARLFPSNIRQAAALLYAWCRHCDDEVDERPHEDAASLEVRVERLRDRTRGALGDVPQEAPEFVALQAIARRYGIPETYPMELLEGVAMDARGTHYDAFSALELYCYRVAGTVGLMMTHVMGAHDDQARLHAARLGIAMQLTNIARDVVEDARMGRVYLPAAWLDEEGLAAGDLSGDGADARAARARLARRLVATSLPYYHSGRVGMRYLPLRCAFAAAVAAEVYKEIGTLVLRRGERAWDTRAVVSRPRKAVAAARGVAHALATVPWRVRNRTAARAPAPLPVWRFQESRSLDNG